MITTRKNTTPNKIHDRKFVDLIDQYERIVSNLKVSSKTKHFLKAYDSALLKLMNAEDNMYLISNVDQLIKRGGNYYLRLHELLSNSGLAGADIAVLDELQKKLQSKPSFSEFQKYSKQYQLVTRELRSKVPDFSKFHEDFNKFISEVVKLERYINATLSLFSQSEKLLTEAKKEFQARMAKKSKNFAKINKSINFENININILLERTKFRIDNITKREIVPKLKMVINDISDGISTALMLIEYHSKYSAAFAEVAAGKPMNVTPSVAGNRNTKFHQQPSSAHSQRTTSAKRKVLPKIK